MTTLVEPMELILRSPMGSEPMIYTWPLKKGKGNLRRSEDKHDEAAEIADTIRWVRENIKEIKDGPELFNVLNTFNPNSFDSMTELCRLYNNAVDHYVTHDLPLKSPKYSRVSRPHLKHIIQKCYNKSVMDPNELNHYEAFTPEVYGETSFELICQILDKLHPIGNNEKFVDLGSGVGQVVLQVAALSNCTHCLGIEKANIPATYAKDLEKWFRFWMSFYGKTYTPFKIIHGDFLESLYRHEILESTIVFVNNFAFGPEVDQHLKDIFADLNDGARIFSSKSFCALNFRITERNLSDIGTIMHVSKMDPLKGSVSWTGKPVSYYLHVIDRAKLERYFQKISAARKGGGGSGDKEGDLKSKKRKNVNEVLGDGVDEHSSGSRDSRDSSSVEKENDILVKSSKWSSSSEVDVKSKSKKNSRKVVVILKNKTEEESHHNNTNSNSTSSTTTASTSITAATTTTAIITTPFTILPVDPSSNARPVRAAVANAAAISALEKFETLQHAGFVSKKKGRPRKPLVLGLNNINNLNHNNNNQFNNNNSNHNNNSCSSSSVSSSDNSGELQCSNLTLDSNAAFRPSSEENNKSVMKRKKPAQKIPGLDFFYNETMNSIDVSNRDPSAPLGCVNEKLSQSFNKSFLKHDELPISLNISETGEPISYQLQVYLEECKRQFYSFTKTMQSEHFKKKIENDILEEKKKNAELVKRQKLLRTQVETILSDSLGLLKTRLSELGIQASTPPDFIEQAKGIVCNHHELQRSKVSLESEIRKLELNNESLMTLKERELLESVSRLSGLSSQDAQTLVKKEIETAISLNSSTSFSTLSSSPPSSKQGGGSSVAVAPLLHKLSDITFTKCISSNSPPDSSALLRKRPKESSSYKQQKDWPEKKNSETGLLRKPVEPTKKTMNISDLKGIVVVSDSKIVDLPKIDLAVSMVAANNSTDYRPESEDFRCNGGTPRAEQFQDRLKNIIHSVLSSDESSYSRSISTRTMNDLIQSEIERTLTATPPLSLSRSQSTVSVPPTASISAPVTPSVTNATSGSSSMLRMTQVIEDSIRGQMETSSHEDLEGLAVPRSKSPLMYKQHQQQQHDYRRQQQQQQPPPPPISSSLPPIHQNYHQPMEGLAARFGYASHDSSPLFYESNKRRSSPPTSFSILPPKKQILESAAAAEHYRSQPKEDTQQRRWQDEISSGFDRLVAYATEVVDKRRKSSESNSPAHSLSSQAQSSNPPPSLPIPPISTPTSSFSNDFMDTRNNLLNMKFKGAGYHHKVSTTTNSSSDVPPLSSQSLSSRVPTPGSLSSRIPTPTEGSVSGLCSRADTPSSHCSRVTTPGGCSETSIRLSKSPAPGERLSDHLPKKRYFAESREQRLSSTESSSNGSNYIKGRSGSYYAELYHSRHKSALGNPR